MPMLKCLTPECKGSKAFKGLCSACYKDAKRLVDLKQTTWEELEEMGLAESEQKHQDGFMKAFKERKQPK